MNLRKFGTLIIKGVTDFIKAYNIYTPKQNTIFKS